MNLGGKDQLANIKFGHSIAKEISRLEIGQTVIVKDGTVLAVEGFAGSGIAYDVNGWFNY